MAGRLFPLGVPAAFRSLLSAGLVVGGGSRGGDLREGGEEGWSQFWGSGLTLTWEWSPEDTGPRALLGELRVSFRKDYGARR